MQAMVTCDENWGLSIKDRPFVEIPRERTSKLKEVEGKVVVFDYPYLQFLPGQCPVVGCQNYIYMGNRTDSVKGAKCFSDLSLLAEALAKENDQEVYIIHGESVYDFFYEKIQTFHVTKVEYTYQTDAFLKNLDRDENFMLTADSDEQYSFDVVYRFLKYERR